MTDNGYHDTWPDSPGWHLIWNDEGMDVMFSTLTQLVGIEIDVGNKISLIY